MKELLFKKILEMKQFKEFLNENVDVKELKRVSILSYLLISALENQFRSS